MNPEIAALIEQIHAAGTRFVLAVTGGGSGAISSLLSVPGASRSVIMATVPYSEAALAEWLGARPEQHCTERTARTMAMAALQKARQLEPNGAALMGVACTASLATDRPKQGDHRFHIATQTATTTRVVSVTLSKGHRSRLAEEDITTRALLNAIAVADGVKTSLPIAWHGQEQPIVAECTAPPSWQALQADNVQSVSQPANAPTPRVLLPGAFNPLHDAHRQMATIAEKMLGEPVAFELSIINVDKPPLDYLDMERRAAQFANDAPLWFTRARTFAEKAVLFPGVTFVVGIDTLARIAEPRYAGGVAQMLNGIQKMGIAGCRFLVFGREVDGKFQEIADLNLPPSLAVICQQVPESDFRLDISSTQLRTQAEPGKPG